MTYYIARNSSAVNTMEFDSIEAAIAFATAPAWAGAKPTEIKMVDETNYIASGLRYTIVKGRNPRLVREPAKPTFPRPAPSREAFDRNGKFRGLAWLSREMDRADSDF